MFRLLGFLIGSATAILMILLILGVPNFHLPDSGIDQQRFDAVVEKLKEKQQGIAIVTEAIVNDVATVAEETPDEIEMATETELPQLIAHAGEGNLRQQVEDDLPVPKASPNAEDYPVIVDELQWYSFWNPFRSEIAANGFVTQLEKVTGLDYRVVRIKTGVYEVAFAYNNDTELRRKLSQISAATGLDLPGS